MRKCLGTMLAAWLLLDVPLAPAGAQENFPNRPIRVVNPYSVGSVADVFGRIVTQHMAEQWKASIILESNPVPTARSRLKTSRAPKAMDIRGCW